MARGCQEARRTCCCFPGCTSHSSPSESCFLQKRRSRRPGRTSEHQRDDRSDDRCRSGAGHNANAAAAQRIGEGAVGLWLRPCSEIPLTAESEDDSGLRARLKQAERCDESRRPNGEPRRCGRMSEDHPCCGTERGCGGHNSHREALARSSAVNITNGVLIVGRHGGWQRAPRASFRRRRAARR